jgi:hypothetical protein
MTHLLTLPSTGSVKAICSLTFEAQRHFVQTEESDMKFNGKEKDICRTESPKFLP